MVVTYNHEKYIRQALDSILMQQVDFDYEIVIGEDYSVDGTREIVIEYKKRYPDKIKLLFKNYNIGAGANFLRTFETCSGDYIAYLDGDDFWSAADKLQKQVDYLDKSPGIALCFHAVQVLSEIDQSSSYIYTMPVGQTVFALRDLLEGNFIPSCTTVFKKGLFGKFPDWYFQLGQGDWSLHLLNAQHGNIGYIDEVMASYRSHSGGGWTGMASLEREESIIATYEAFNSHLKFCYDSLICSRMAEHYFDLLDRYEAEGDDANFHRTALRARSVLFRARGGRLLIMALLGMRCYSPWLYRVLRRVKSAVLKSPHHAAGGCSSP